MEILLFLLISYVLFSITLMKLFEKAGVQGSQALIPGTNFIVMCRLVGQPASHAAWLLFPIVNIFIFVGLCVDMVRSFGKYKLWQSALTVLYAPAMFYMIGREKSDKYLGPTIPAEKEYRQKLHEAEVAGNERELQKLKRQNPYYKSPSREWVEAIFFAVFAAAFIRMFLIEAYTIPTPSMEGSLKVGDFLFVSKAHYGIRTPQTVLMLPLLHNQLPIVGGETYLSKPSLPYYRLPGLTSVKRYDPVVFNYPEGDSVYVFPERTWSINDFRRNAISPERMAQIKMGKAGLHARPVDKRDHYIKRCIGLPGDSLKIVNRQVFINGKPARNPSHLQYRYLLRSPTGSINLDKLAEFGVNVDDSNPELGVFVLDSAQVQNIREMDPSITINLIEHNEPSNGYLFPHDDERFPGWTMDNFGPVYIPAKGATVKINSENIALYQRIIDIYEENDLEIKDGKIFINGQQTDSYTFKMDYYWMMGDNRHNSEDSRVWGFVPHDHIVGKPLFIFVSRKKGGFLGFDWSRTFNSAYQM